MHRLLAFFLALMGLLLPLPAFAGYLEPEDVLLRDQSAFFLPSNRREALQNAQQQAQVSLGKDRPTVREWSAQPQVAETPTPALHASPPDAAPADGTDASDATDTSNTDVPAADAGIDPITLRWLRRLEHLNTLRSATLEQTLQSTATHAGAPLADSGPAETATVIVIIGAVGWTLYRARRMEQFVRL